MPANVIALAHVPVRSRDQIVCKIAIGWLAHLASSPDPQAAYHWRDAYREFANGRLPARDALLEMAANYGVPRDAWQTPDSIPRMSDPFLASFELRYPALAASQPLPYILKFAERLVG